MKTLAINIHSTLDIAEGVISIMEASIEEFTENVKQGGKCRSSKDRSSLRSC